VGRRWLVFAILLLLIGAISTLSGFSAKQGSSFTLGVSLLIIGLALLLRWFGLGERPTFSLAGIALLVWWLLPMDISESLFGEMKTGIEMFFISGMMMVLGAVWVISYNLSILFRLLTTISGPLKGITPALKTAIAYPMNNRFRTGLTLAMFSLVIFTMIFMSVVIGATTGALRDVEAFSGGYDVWGTVSYNNPIPDI
jgi:putative ABC transport system permease protein